MATYLQRLSCGAAVALICEGLFELLERSKIILKFTDRKMEIDVVSLEEGMNLRPGPEAQHAAHLPFRQAFAAVSFQREGFQGCAR